MTRNLRRSYHNCYLSECLQYFENNHALYYNDDACDDMYNVYYISLCFVVFITLSCTFVVFMNAINCNVFVIARN